MATKEKGPSKEDLKPQAPTETLEGQEIPTRRVRVMMVNPVDFMFMFVKGMEFRKHTKIAEGLPADAQLVGMTYDVRMDGILMVIQSEEFDEIPINVVPPIQPMEIKVGKPDATKKKKVPRKKK